MGWRGQLSTQRVTGSVVKDVVHGATCNDSIVDGILEEASHVEEDGSYDLIAIGASEEWFLKNMLLGSITDRIADEAPCSVLVVRKYEPAAVSWLRRITGMRQRQSAS